jgi:hypothetical protein
MRIVILEDRMDRLRNFFDDDLESYPEITVISGEYFIRITTGLQKNDTTFLKDYDCIAAHRSALQADTIAALKSFCTTTGKPLIFFSGGITTSILKEKDFPFLLINSKEFYSSHLGTFIEDGKINGRFNLNVMQFGNRWQLSSLLSLRNRLVVGRNKGSFEWAYQYNIPKWTKQLLAARPANPLPANEYTTQSEEQVNTLIGIINQLIFERA